MYRSGAAISPMRKNAGVLLPLFLWGRSFFALLPFSLDLQQNSHLSRAGQRRRTGAVHYALNFMSISLPWQKEDEPLVVGRRSASLGIQKNVPSPFSPAAAVGLIAHGPPFLAMGI